MEEVSAEVDMRRRKRAFLVSVFIRNVLSNMEYSIIIPSILLYITRLGEGKVATGFAVAMYPFAGMISLPINGYIYDRTRCIRELFYAMNALQVVGSLVYALPYSVAFPVLGRFLSGLGDGVISDVCAEITNLYPGEERLAIMSVLELGRILGLISGPVVAIIIKDMHFGIAGWKLDYLNLPGFVMVVFWLVMQILTYFFVHNNAKYLQKKQKAETANNNSIAVIGCDNKCFETSYEIAINENESGNQSSPNNTQVVFESTSTTGFKFGKYWKVISKSCYSLEFLVLFYVEFSTWFMQVQFELIIPYLSELEYGWTPFITSLFYLAGGILIIFIFVLMSCLSKKYPIHDAKLLLLSVALIQVALILLIFEPVPATLWHRKLIAGAFSFLLFCSLPLNLVCTKNLITKIYPAGVQGVIQGVFSFASRIAMISGPIVISVLFTERQKYSVGLSAINVLAFVSMATILKKIVAKENQCT